MSNALKIAPPPPRPQSVSEPVAVQPVPPAANVPPAPRQRQSKKVIGPKFAQVKEDAMVQFNKRVTQRVADGYELLAIRFHRKVPELLAEALELLEDRYGKI